MNRQQSEPLVLDLSKVGAGDVALVGGKCASLGELFRSLVPRGVRSLDGFATTSEAIAACSQARGWASVCAGCWIIWITKT
jgi:phosphoenolpyruvate synthase/pyruvate phosphate dikinase